MYLFYCITPPLPPPSRDECKSQVEKFPCAIYKKFASEKDAWAFFRGAKPTPVASPVKGRRDSKSSDCKVGLYKALTVR